MPALVYRCTQCHREFQPQNVRYLCPKCGDAYKPGIPLPGVLEAVFDVTHVRQKLAAGQSLSEALCAVESRFFPPMVVGKTPLHPTQRLVEQLGLRAVFIKNDGQNPSGSLKDRASFLVVAQALQLGEKTVVCASTGNAASSLASVCASAGLTALIFVPQKAPRAKLVQMVLSGARVLPVQGTYDDAFRLSLEYTRARGGLNRNTAYHPLTIEGKKTAALEIVEQLGGRAPDAVLVSVGDGVILAGLHKGFGDLRALGIISDVPMLIGVQAEKSDAIHRYVESGRYADAAHPHTIADSISVSCPSNAHWAKRAIEQTRGLTLTVTDEDILAGQSRLAAATGIFAEPAAAAAFAGLLKLQSSARALAKDAEVVVLVTGHGLKDVDAPLSRLSIPPAIEAHLDAVPQ